MAPFDRNAPALPLLHGGKMGARFIQEEVCVACGKCEAACSYPINRLAALTEETFAGRRIFYDAKKNVCTKCDMCHWRPEGPVCVGACPVHQHMQIQ